MVCDVTDGANVRAMNEVVLEAHRPPKEKRNLPWSNVLAPIQRGRTAPAASLKFEKMNRTPAAAPIPPAPASLLVRSAASATPTICTALLVLAPRPDFHYLSCEH